MRACPGDQVYVSQRGAVAPYLYKSASSALEVPRASHIKGRRGRRYTITAGGSEDLIATLSCQGELSREKQCGRIETNEFADGCSAKGRGRPATSDVKADGIGRTLAARSGREANQCEVTPESGRALPSFVCRSGQGTGYDSKGNEKQKSRKT